jgi:flagellum-specific ATP synthase
MTDQLSNHPYLQTIRAHGLVRRAGAVRRIMPTYVEADGPGVPVGTLCTLGCADTAGAVDAAHQPAIIAEVTRTEAGRVTLMPYSKTSGLRIGDRVVATDMGDMARVGPQCLGRAFDALGAPVDGGQAIRATHWWPLHGKVGSPLQRTSSRQVLHTGVRAIDGLLTLAVGQRVGVFAGSGVGKTTLLGALARQVQADSVVACLIGERGREASDFWQACASGGVRDKTALVVATSEQPAVMRVRAANLALALAEHLRDQGQHVLLLLDSVTRLGMAMREIGLAAGEPPTLRAYTPSVFAQLPRLVERCGSIEGRGSITAFMTVLTETDDADDPLAEFMRSLLDGHIVLSRTLAEQGHFPAIHVTRSISRLMRQVCELRVQTIASQAIAQLSLYDSSKTLIDSGLYSAGANPALDQAIAARPHLLAFLRQTPEEASKREDTLLRLQAIVHASH